MAYQRVEVLTGTERRRNYTAAQKARFVAEAFRPGVVVKEAARRLGVHESLLYRWRQTLTPPTVAEPVGFLPVAIVPEPETVVEQEALASPVATGPSAATPASATSPPVLDITLPGGARVRLEGPVDPALVVTVLRTLAPPGRAP